MSTRPLPLWRRALKVLLWTAMALVLLPAAIILCLLRTLDDEHLTRLAVAAANRALDADVRIGRAALSLRPGLPLVRLDLDSVTVISRPMLRMSGAERADVPAWADTLLTLDHFHGGINPAALLAGRIELRDVTFDRPAINIVTVSDSLSNYLIVPASETAAPDTASMSIPHITIERFRILHPAPLRYHNVQTGEHFTLGLQAMEIDGARAPSYRLNIGGELASPALAVYNLDRLDFGVDGGVAWNPDRPSEVELRDFDLTAAFVRAKLNAHIDLGTDIVVRDYSLELGRTGISHILGVIPDSLRRAWGIGPERLATDLEVSFSARSTAPFNLTDDSIPHADMTLTILPGRLDYGGARLTHVGGELLASLRGNDLGLATFEARGLSVAGPATDLHLDAKASEVTTDPLVSGCLRGTTNLRRLPDRVADLARGFLSGRVDADIDFEGRLSMLSRDGFHRLRVDGDIDGRDLYYLSNDTATMVAIDRACFRLGTHSRVRTASGASADSLLTASLRIDSADILHTQYSMKLTDLSLGVGASNRGASADTTAIIPMGGRLDLGSFGLVVLGDSIVFRMRDTHGMVSMQRFRGDSHMPLFNARLDIGRMATGDPSTRFMLSGAHVDVGAHMLPRKPVPPAIRHTADSLSRVHPDLPADSVYRYAILAHRRRHRQGPPRVHLEYTEAETEMINWGTSKLVRRMLLGWAIEGNLTARRTGLYTPYFPIRNRVRDFNIHFNNDSILLTDVRYKAGHSDFLLSGRISNLKRGFTSRGFRSPLKINLEVVSDTIDVNELAGSTFRGSAYAAAADSISRSRTGAHHRFDMAAIDRAEEADDERLEREMGRIVADAPDSMAPLLIPRNIDMTLDMRARNVLYSDINFRDFSGRLLAYQGALNLHHLKARADVGSLNLNALYSATDANDIKFGFGMQVADFDLHSFTRLVPAIDSIMPLLRDIRGTVGADLAATCDIDRGMNLVLPTLTAAVRLQGDSLELIDKDTYRTIGKWLLFKDKQSNIIDHMDVEVTVRDNMMTLYPFMFDIDRYRLGVQGYNDLALNFDYHIAVLRSPLPFKFGINLKGNPDKYKIRLGKARFNQQQAVHTVSIVDTARVNLLNQIENIFRRGLAGSRFARLNIDRRPTAADIDLSTDTISHADSLLFIKEGLLPAPPEAAPAPDDRPAKRKKKQRKTAATRADAIKED